MGIRNTYLKMIQAILRAIEAIADSIGVPLGAALSNRIYELKDNSAQGYSTLDRQAASGTTLITEASAEESGGTFVALPQIDEHCDKEELFRKFTQTVDERTAF